MSVEVEFMFAPGEDYLNPEILPRYTLAELPRYGDYINFAGERRLVLRVEHRINSLYENTFIPVVMLASKFA